MNDWLLSMQQWPTDPYPEFAGRFYDPKRPFGPPHASSTGVYMEGLIDAYRLARDRQEVERAESYRLAICRGIRSLMQLTFQEQTDTYYSTKPERLHGGVRTTCYNNVIRIDNVQHNLLALFKIIDTFAEEDYSTEPLEVGDSSPEQHR
jgi:hypothetical protein